MNEEINGTERYITLLEEQPDLAAAIGRYVAHFANFEAIMWEFFAKIHGKSGTELMKEI